MVQRRTASAGLGGIVCRLVIGMVLVIGVGLSPPPLHGAEQGAVSTAPLPLLVNARRGDTAASLAQRYLKDAAKGWMIDEYNGKTTFSEGEAVLVPLAPFRPGGLTADGYQTVPVLAYADIEPSTGNPRQVSRSAFNEQMQWLKKEGFTAITPSQFFDFMKLSCQLPERSVLITADTESRTFYDLAVPVLKTYGFTATLFVATDKVGTAGAMTWDQIEALHQSGFTIGCRGQRGRSLTFHAVGRPVKSYFNAIASELRLAKQIIETRLNAPCTALAYPDGDTNGLVTAMAAKMGFAAAFVLTAGDNPFFGDRFGIHRITVDSRMNPEQFGHRLTFLITADLK